MHLRFSHGHGYQYVCIAEPRIQIVVYNPKRCGDPKHKPYRDFVITGPEERFQTLEEAVIALEKRDEQLRRDAEWEATEAKR